MDMSGAALGNLTATQRDQLMSEVKQQLAVANAQELLTVNGLAFFFAHCQLIKLHFQFTENHREMLQKMR